MKQIILFCLALIYFVSVQATHMMGGDMSYKCLGNGKYKITAKIYRDCRGVPFNSPEFGVFAGTNGGNGCGSSALSISRTGIKDVTPRCSTASSPCSPQNTYGTGEGIEEHTYEVTVDFNTSPLSGYLNKSTCCEVTFYIGQCCRNGAITTGPASEGFYTTCMINICNIKKTINKCNNSPTLSNAPIGFLCCNQAYYFNNGAIDTVDYDSFSYSLTNGINTLPNNSVSYSSPFTPRYFMTPYCIPPTSITCTPNPKTNPPRGLFFDTSSGDIILTPTKCDEVAIAVITITEWRKDSASGKFIMIGRTRRDMQLIVKDDCGYNKAPTLLGPYNWKVCEGETLKFKVESDDETFTPYQKVPDTTNLKWNKGIPGATFKLANKVDWPEKRKAFANFEWTPSVGMASDISYSFTVTVTDDHCPKPSQAIRGFKVKVNPRAFSIRKYTNLKCGKFAMAASVSLSFKGAPQFKWSVRDSLGKSEIYYSTKKSDTMTFYRGGKYIIVHTVNNSDNCPTIYRDTVIIPNPPQVVMADADTFACFGTTMKLNANILFGNSPFKYYWTRVVKDTGSKAAWKSEEHILGDTFQTLSIPNINRDSTVRLKITDGDGCIFYDTTTIYKKPLPVVGIGIDQRICTYEIATFDAQNSDTVKYMWSTGDTTRIFKTNLKGTYWVQVMETKWKCVKYDTAIVFVNDTVITNAGPNQAICDKDTFTLTASHRPPLLIPTYTWGGLGNLSTYKLKSDITKSTYMFTLKTILTQNGRSCEDMDTMFVRIKPLPKISWSPKPLKPECYSYGDKWMEPFIIKPHNFGTYDIWSGTKNKIGNIVTPYFPYNGRFLFNTISLDNSKLQGGNNFTTKVYVKFNDTNGCSNIDSTTQTIYGTPMITLVPKTICQDIGSMMMDVLRTRPATKSGVYMRWDVVRAPSGIDTSKLLYDISGGVTPNIKFNFGLSFQDEYQGKYTFKLIVRDLVTGCQSTDTVDVNVIAEPTVIIKTIPDYCVNSGINVNMFDYITVNGVKPTGGTIYVQDVNGDRSHPKVTTNISTGLFKTSTGPGVYNIKYVSSQFGCVKIDSFNIIVHDTSDLRVRDTTICASAIPLDVLTLAVSNKGGTIVNYPDGRFFNGTTTPTGYVPGPYKWMMIGLTPYNCQDTEYAKITIVNIPKVKFVKPIEVCEFDTITLKIDTQYLNGGTFNWIPIATFGPTMNRKYVPTITDTSLGYVDVRVDWSVAKNVCPNPFDTVRVYIHQYPDPMFTYQNGCEPLNTTFTPTERKGINPSLLTYNWYVNTNSISTNNGSVPYLFSTQGQYQITLSITNVEGKKQCNRTITQTVNVYPKPSVVFNTDPLYKTTVALPKFKTINTSSVSQNPFVTNMKHNWTWGKTYKIGTDTLKNSNIVFGKDTGTYWIKLIVTTDKGCKDSSMKKVVIGPDIIIFVPDAFTPDDAGPNENNTFRPYVINNKTYEMLIFNRWGEKMYETTDLTKGWDGNYLGKPAPDGVYVYKMMVTSLEDKVFQYNGTFTLIR
jgi:gliding motility-associated-like protein